MAKTNGKILLEPTTLKKWALWYRQTATVAHNATLLTAAVVTSHLHHDEFPLSGSAVGPLLPETQVNVVERGLRRGLTPLVSDDPYGYTVTNTSQDQKHIHFLIQISQVYKCSRSPLRKDSRQKSLTLCWRSMRLGMFGLGAQGPDQYTLHWHSRTA